MAGPIRLGMLAWNQYTDWPALRAFATRADALGYDDLWTWDHLYPIVGSDRGPILEGWMVLVGWTLTVLEGFLWPNVLSLLSHLCYAASSVLAAAWCWLAFVAKPNEDRDVVRGH